MERACPDCSETMVPIVIGDLGRFGYEMGLRYYDASKPRKVRQQMEAAGIISAVKCVNCHRVLLYAEPLVMTRPEVRQLKKDVHLGWAMLTR